MIERSLPLESKNGGTNASLRHQYARFEIFATATRGLRQFAPART